METVKRTRQMVYIALFVVVIAVCAWISIPSFVPFTLQSFAIASVLLLLGGRNGTLTVFTYILLGMVGLPVFSSFTGGMGLFMGPNGGFLWGFVLMALTYWLITCLFKNKKASRICGMAAGMILCYISGMVHYVFVYLPELVGIESFATAFMTCVLPFIIPDAVKIALAFVLTDKLKKYIKF